VIRQDFPEHDDEKDAGEATALKELSGGCQLIIPAFQEE
jgi:hypothetical protein